MTAPALGWYFDHDYPRHGRFDLPGLVSQYLDVADLKLIRFSETVRREARDRDATVHFFENDDRFDEVWNRPDDYLVELSQYRQLLTPDFSLNWGAPITLQILNTFRSRWCGWYWQSRGMTVVPTVSWSDSRSFEFCFDGIDRGSVVAVSTVGCRDRKPRFLSGYRELHARLYPTAVICYGEPFAEMSAENLIVVPYSRNTRVATRR